MERRLERVLHLKRNKDGSLLVSTLFDILDDIETYHHLCECHTCDYVKRTIGNRPYTFICDDEYWLRNGNLDLPPVSVGLDNQGHPREIIMGALVITGPGDFEGELTSLNQDDIDRIMKHVRIWSDYNDTGTFDAIEHSF